MDQRTADMALKLTIGMTLRVTVRITLPDCHTVQGVLALRCGRRHDGGRIADWQTRRYVRTNRNAEQGGRNAAWAGIEYGLCPVRITVND